MGWSYDGVLHLQPVITVLMVTATFFWADFLDGAGVFT